LMPAITPFMTPTKASRKPKSVVKVMSIKGMRRVYRQSKQKPRRPQSSRSTRGLRSEYRQTLPAWGCAGQRKRSFSDRQRGRVRTNQRRFTWSGPIRKIAGLAVECLACASARTSQPTRRSSLPGIQKRGEALSKVADDPGKHPRGLLVSDGRYRLPFVAGAIGDGLTARMINLEFSCRGPLWRLSPHLRGALD
jgi:hypothetical protein